MLNRGRGGPSNRGSRGRGNPSNQGGRNSGYTLAQYGNKKLIAADLSGDISEISQTEPKEVWKQPQGTNVPSSSSNPSFAFAVQNTTQKEDDMLQNEEERIILFLSETDKKWKDKPWTLYDRYLGGHGYTMETYKPRHFYEIILSNNGCTFNHFTNANTKEIYNFSKIVIGQVISMNDWGISPLTEKTVTIRGTPVKYNYWDYIQAFDKVFFYENNKRSHTWFIKINHEVYNDLPIWMIKWWQFYGTSENILPDFIKEYFDKWKEVKPLSQDDKIIPENMRFFIEFSIPWIWRTTPITAYSQNLFCLKRRSYTRFWDTMLKQNDKGQLSCISTIELLQERISSYTSLKEIEDKECREKEKARFLEILDDDESMDIQEASKEQIIRAYMDGLRKTLKLKAAGEKQSDIEGDKRSSKSDTSMASNNSHNSFSTLLQDAQDPDDDQDVDKILAFLQGEK